MSAHALLSPSSAGRWMACTPSVRLEEKLPDATSAYADEGTLFHDLAANWLQYTLGWLSKADKAYKDMAITRHALYRDEMVQHANDYVRYCMDIYNSHAEAYAMIEQRFDISHWVPESFGTSDFNTVNGRTLHVVDLKYGQGVPVTAVDNTQLKLYALGTLELTQWFTRIDKIKLHIFQPRLGNISTWMISVDELFYWAETELARKAALAFNGKGDFVAGEHCRFCKAKTTCKALAAYNTDLAKYDFQLPELLSNREIAEVLTKADVFINWINSVKDHALKQALSGVKYPGYKVVAGRSSRIITNEKKAMETLLKAGYAKSEIVNEALKGIMELEKVLGRGDYHKLLQQFVIKPKGKPVLVPVTDNRAALNSTGAAVEDFKHLKF